MPKTRAASCSLTRAGLAANDVMACPHAMQCDGGKMRSFGYIVGRKGSKIELPTRAPARMSVDKADLVLEHGFTRLLAPSVETPFRHVALKFCCGLRQIVEVGADCDFCIKLVPLVFGPAPPRAST